MGNSVRDKKPNSRQPIDLMSRIADIEDSYGTVQTHEITRQGVQDTYEYLHKTTPYDNPDDLATLNASKQPLSDLVKRSATQFGANLASSFGQGLANTFDLVAAKKSLANSVKDVGNTLGGNFQAEDDDFESHLFGLSTKDMQEWANNVAANNKIYEREEGGFNPSDPGWWGKQIASAGTGVGMGLEALTTTALIEGLTGGLGSGAALAKLGNVFNKLKNGAKGAEAMADAMSVTKGLKSAATMYGALSRLSESRMEASNSYDNIYQQLSAEKNADGSNKYTDLQAKHFASEGARRDYNINMALLPLDILSFRTMIYNPISGSGTGLLEKGLDKVAGIYGKSKLGKAAGWLTSKGIGANIEGLEEGFQNIGESEGVHYAKVLGGTEDGSSFVSRALKQATTDEFWNNYAGGVLGSPIIGGAMNVVNKITQGNKASLLNDTRKEYIKNVGKMDSALATKIKLLESQGDTEGASRSRQQYSANNFLSGLHLDAMTNSDTAFNAKMALVDGVLEDLSKGKTDTIKDAGFLNTTPEQLQVIQKEFQQYKKDGENMKRIYDSVKDKYAANFVPEITSQHFEVSKLTDELAEVNTKIATAGAKVPEFTQLSSQGKQLHAIEYQLNALRLENKNLKAQQKEAALLDPDELANFDKLLEQNSNKIAKLDAQVNEISKDESYTKEQRDTDDDIFNSSLLSGEYLQAIYDKEGIENSISYKRKNIALWNKPEYQNRKATKSVKQLSTKQQIAAAKATAPTPEVAKALDEQESKVISAEAATMVNSIKNPIESVPGNAALVTDDLQNIADIQSVTPIQTQTTTQEVYDGEPMAYFSPTAYDFENSSEEAKNKLKQGVAGLQEKLGNTSSFEDIVRHVIKLKGTQVADEIYNSLAFGWEANGNPPTDFDYVYRTVFVDSMDAIMEGAAQLKIQNTPALMTAETDKVIGTIEAEEKAPAGYDTNNQPVYRYETLTGRKSYVTHEYSPKGAYVSRASKMIRTYNDDGTITISHEYTDEELNRHNKWIDATILLDPDKMNGGESTTIRIPPDFNDVFISVYKPDGSYDKSMTFGQYVATKGLKPTDQEYKDKIPMVHYIAGQEKGIMFVHDVGWYHPERFSQEYKDDMKKAIDATRSIREEVIANNAKGEGTPATITGKRQTTFEGCKTPKMADGNYELITIREGNPNTDLMVSLAGGYELDSSKKNQEFPNNETELTNKTPFSSGQILDVRRFGLHGGVKTYTAFNIFRYKLDEDARSSVLQAITIYGNMKTADAATRLKHDAVIKSIKDTMGLNITTEDGLRKYLKHFVAIFNPQASLKNNTDVERIADQKLKEGTRYISFTASTEGVGSLVFGIAGKHFYKESTSDTLRKSFFISPNATKAPTTALKYFTDPKFGVLDWYEQNLDIDGLNVNKPIVTIRPDFTTPTTAKSYKDHLLDRFKTNIRSFNIGTEAEPNYVTNVQPIVTYETNKRLEEQGKLETMEETAPQVVQAFVKPVDSVVEDTVAIEEKARATKEAEELLAQLKKELGEDFGLNYDASQLSANALQEHQRETIGKDVDKIAGLSPSQQSTVVDYIFNQIVPEIDANRGVVTEKQIDAVIQESIKVIFDPAIVEAKAKIAHLNGMLEKFPHLKEGSQIEGAIQGLELKIAQIESILDDLDSLNELAKQKVNKYTNIKSKRVKQSSLEQEKDEYNIDSEDEGISTRTDFAVDVFSENPESKATYQMRRFFGQIQSVDAKGEPKIGFLGLPIYEDSAVVLRTLMTSLANIPSNFEEFMKKLESRQEALPWMASAIAKIKAADPAMRDTFTTVMTNNSLRMKFMMISYNRKQSTWQTKVYSTNLGGVSDGVKELWRGNLFDINNSLILNDGGNYVLNKTRAKYLIDRFKSWKGETLEQVENLESLRKDVVGVVKLNQNSKIKPTGALLQELKTKIVKQGDKLGFSMANQNYQIYAIGDGQYEISLRETFLSQGTESRKAIEEWLGEFGIVLSPGALTELMTKGLWHNYKQRTYQNLFEGGTSSNGLFGILSSTLENLITKDEFDFTENGDSPLDNSVISSLAALEAEYNEAITPAGFRDNGKSYFGLTPPKFIMDRARDLKLDSDGLRKELEQISFSKESFWLRLLKDPEFRAKFKVDHLGDTAIKEKGKSLYKDNSLPKLADADHELTKKGMFEDMKQGAVSYNNDKGKTIKTFPDTNIEMRMATMFSPTMSDKHIMTLITTAVLNLNSDDLLVGQGINNEVAKVLYKQLVKPELLRMVKFAQRKGTPTNIEGYNEGASQFLFIPEMNNIEFLPGLKLVDAIKNQPETFNVEQLESGEESKEVMDKIYTLLKEYTRSLADEKIGVWKNNGYVTETLVKNDDGTETSTVTGLKYFNNAYINKQGFNGSLEAKLNMAALDYVVNNLISNANSFMLFAGDPAMYYKEGKKFDENGVKRESLLMEKMLDTFTNVGKRLANQIAPGTTLANSIGDRYLQLFIEDRNSAAENLEYIGKVFGVDSNEYKKYSKTNATDAQEYTTWKEHLDILGRLGKLNDVTVEITPDEIQRARDLFSSGAKLTEKDMELVGKVFQPMKPVYTGQIYDEAQDVMRTVYIKSSSFPLIPQLTAGLEIDKLRLKMEELQDMKSHGLNVRASYQSANKVGAMNNATKLWDDDGRIIQENLDKLADSSLVLERTGFRIQQDVPYKSGKVGEDTITLGTQLMKLLFGDEIMNYDGYNYGGETLSGTELHRIYNDKFLSLVSEKRNQLFSELGLDADGNSSNIARTMEKMQEILKEEAIKRDYPLQDINALKLMLVKDNAGRVINSEFAMPLWSSTNSNRYESMLNSIVSNRLIKMKFPGTSLVLGSEEGFRTKVQEDLTGVDESKMIYTPAWNGSHLQASTHEDGTLKHAQVFMTSKFKDREGNLVDLFTMEGGKYKYVTKAANGFTLNANMIDKDLLANLGFRLPTSGHQSATIIEIAGFLPAQNADLIIAPKNFTIQMGSDFDVDKLYNYQLHHYLADNGKFEVLSEKHKTQILAKAEEIKKDEKINKLIRQYREAAGPIAKKTILAEINREEKIRSLFADIGGGEYTGEDIAYTNEEIGELNLSKVNSKFKEKMLQNDIIRIHHSVYSNKAVEKKIIKTLNTDFVEKQADIIEGLGVGNVNKYWTALSDEYQKQKLMSGSSGKVGTGAYSIDVVLHSLALQAAKSGRPIELKQTLATEDSPLVGVNWRFGKGTKYMTDGILGRATTIDGGRSIAEVVAERQNLAVDNEKLQIMARVGINEITLDVDKVFNLLGFDKGEDGNSIAMLFLSQPVIREYVTMLRNASSNMAEYDKDKEQKVITALNNKYNPKGEILTDDLMSDRMSNANMTQAIRDNGTDGQLQVAVLKRFLEMKKYGEGIRAIQASINSDSKGLGKSFFDVIEKRNALNRIGSPSEIKNQTNDTIGFITGASGLIGTYETTEKMSPDRMEELKKQGYIDIGKFMVKPDTLSGAFNVMGVTTAYNLWSDYFPYDTETMADAFKEILDVIGGEYNATRNVEDKQEIFQGLKRYFAASKLNGIIDARDSINEERKRLYIDSENNMSLATYLKNLKQVKGSVIVEEFIKTNKLLNRFEYDINKNGDISKIRFKNAAGEDFDEQYMYQALASMMEVKGKTGSITLPITKKEFINGEIVEKIYTLDTLAQDLAAYCMLGNAVQEAIQFTKYIPLSYLEQIGYASKMRMGNNWLKYDGRVLGETIGLETEDNKKHLIREFPMQYIQHNPEKVKYPFDSKDVANVNGEGGKFSDIESVQSFTLTNEDTPTFIKAYNPSIPKGEKKFSLFWFDGKKYVRIPVLGTFGMDEYQPQEKIGKTIVNGKTKMKLEPQGSIKGDQEIVSDLLSINSEDTGTVLNKIAASNIAGYSELATALRPFIGKVRISYADTVGTYTNFEGLYHQDEIYISPKVVNPLDVNKTARVVLHEVVHVLTVKQIQPYIKQKPDGTVEVVSTAPAYVSDMVRLYNNVRGLSDKKELQDVINKVRLEKTLTSKEKGEKYGLTDIYEFMSMALTQKEFQKYLSKAEFKQSGMTLLEKFKQIISNVLSKLGVTFESDTAAAQAINSIFQLIESSNQNVTTAYTEESDEWISEMQRQEDEFNDFARDNFDDFVSGDVSGNLSPNSYNSFPKVDLDIKNTKCL